MEVIPTSIIIEQAIINKSILYFGINDTINYNDCYK